MEAMDFVLGKEEVLQKHPHDVKVCAFLKKKRVTWLHDDGTA